MLNDTGATSCAQRLSVNCLVQGVAMQETLCGDCQGFSDVELLYIGDRRGTFDCCELTEVDYHCLREWHQYSVWLI